jgi:hypothetical protein
MAEVKRRTTVGEETVGGTRLKVTFSDLETTRTAWSTNVSLEEIGKLATDGKTNSNIQKNLQWKSYRRIRMNGVL